MYLGVPGYRIRRCLITPARGGFPSSIARQTKSVPIPNDASSESSRRDVSNAGRFARNGNIFGTIQAMKISSMEKAERFASTGTIFGTIQAMEISSMENRPRDVLYTPSYAVRTLVVFGHKSGKYRGYPRSVCRSYRTKHTLCLRPFFSSSYVFCCCFCVCASLFALPHVRPGYRWHPCPATPFPPMIATRGQDETTGRSFCIYLWWRHLYQPGG